MLLRALTVATGLLALPATQAFLIPPEVSNADIHVANTIESVGPQVAESQVVNVECPGCPISVRGRHGKNKNTQLNLGRQSHLELTFSVDHLPDHDRLLVNGFELYPSGDPAHEILSAPQIVDWDKKEKRHHREHNREGRRGGHREDHRGNDHHDHYREDGRPKRPHRLTPQPQRLGFGLHVAPSKKDADGQFELVEIELQIIEVGVAFIDGIPSVKVQLIKDSEGRLLLSQVEKSEPKLLKHPEAGAEECTTIMCKWLAIAREKLKSLKGFGNCHGGKMEGGMGSDVADDTPHAHHHPHPDHHHVPASYPGHRWGKLFKYIVSHILLPILIGIIAGVSVSLIGMAVGTVIVSSWRFFFRRGSGHRDGHRRHHSRHAHHRAARKEAALSEEKSGLIEHQDPPPSYEEEETVKTSPA